MPDELISKDYEWAFVTSARAVEKGPCELVDVNVEPSADAWGVTLYNGTDTAGDRIVGINGSIKLNWPFQPKKPIYCHKGLFIGGFTNITGVFVQWRKL